MGWNPTVLIFYSLTAPAPRDVTSIFWDAIKNITNGTVTISAPAAKVVKSFRLSVMKLNSPTASVKFAGLRSITRGRMKSIHGPVKLVRARKIIIGFATGRMIRSHV